MESKLGKKWTSFYPEYFIHLIKHQNKYDEYCLILNNGVWGICCIMYILP